MMPAIVSDLCWLLFNLSRDADIFQDGTTFPNTSILQSQAPGSDTQWIRLYFLLDGGPAAPPVAPPSLNAGGES